MIEFTAIFFSTDRLSARSENFQADDIDSAAEQAIESINDFPEEFVGMIYQSDCYPEISS